MKTCPVCKAQAFDDAEVCYGCLYRFEWDNRESCPYHAPAQEDDAPLLEETFFFEDPDPPRLEAPAPSSAAKTQPMLAVPAHTVVAQAPATVVIQLQIQQPSAEPCLV